MLFGVMNIVITLGGGFGGLVHNFWDGTFFACGGFFVNRVSTGYVCTSRSTPYPVDKKTRRNLHLWIPHRDFADFFVHRCGYVSTEGPLE